jgi:hypothetical protein
MGESVAAQSDFGVEYVGDPIVEGDYIITLRGIPPGSIMNVLQRRYFERITTDFLAEFAGISIYHVTVVESVSEGAGDYVAEDSDGERLLSFGLRGSRRTQSDGELQVFTTVFGGGSSLDLRTNVLESIGENTDRYIKELSLQQLRPGEINEGDSGALFESLQRIGVVLKPADFGAAGDDDGSGKATGEGKEGNDNALWLYLCIAGIVVSVLFLAYRVYRDTCYSPKEKKIKLPEWYSPDSGSQQQPGVPPSQRRPSLDGSKKRTPSWDGNSAHNSRPSLDGNSAHNRRPSWDGNGTPPLGVASMHNARPRPPESLSDHGKPPARNHSNHSPGPRNRAGENGRGVRPTKSMPHSRKPSWDGNGMPPLGVESMHNARPNAPKLKPPARNHSNHSPRPRNRAGENGRGVRPTKSMPHNGIPSSDENGRPPPGAASVHNARPRPPESLSDHGPAQPSVQPRSNDAQKLKPPARNHSNHSPGPKNRAGENGRGVRPTKSMPMNMMRLPPGQQRPAPPTESDSPRSNSSDSASFAVESVATDSQRTPDGKKVSSITKSLPKRGVPKRGVQPSRSMPMGRNVVPAERGSNSSKKHAPQSVSDDESISVLSKKSDITETSAQKKQTGPKKGGIAASKIMPVGLKKRGPLKYSDYDSDSSEESILEEPSQRKQFVPQKHGVPAKKKIPPPKVQSLSDDETRSVMTKESKMSKKSTGGPKNQSGMNGRDIGASKSMPTPIKEKVPLEQFDYGSDSSEESDFEESEAEVTSQYQEAKDLPPKKKKVQPKKHVSKSLSDDAGVVKKKLPPKKLASLCLSDHESQSVVSKQSQLSKKPAPKNQSGMNGRDIGASKSMPTPIKKKVPLKKFDYGSDSSEESDSEESAAKVASQHQQSQVTPLKKKKALPKKHASKSLSDDEGVVKKKIPPKKHASLCLSDHESQSVVSKQSQLSKKPAPKNQSGMNGRGIKAIKSMPTPIKKKVPLQQLDYGSDSSEESDFEESVAKAASQYQEAKGPPPKKKKVPPKKHVSKSLSDDEGVVKKNIPPKKHASPCLSDHESRSVMSKQSQLSKKPAPKNRSEESVMSKKQLALSDMVAHESESSEDSSLESEWDVPKNIFPKNESRRPFVDDDDSAVSAITASIRSNRRSGNQSGKARGIKISKSGPLAKVGKQPAVATAKMTKKVPPRRTKSADFFESRKIKYQARQCLDEDSSEDTKRTSKITASASKQTNRAPKIKLHSEDEKKDDASYRVRTGDGLSRPAEAKP